MPGGSPVCLKRAVGPDNGNITMLGGGFGEMSAYTNLRALGHLINSSRASLNLMISGEL